MFDELSNKLQYLSDKINNKGFLDEENILSTLQEVKIALLEADVNFRVVNSFLKNVKEKAKGKKIIGTLSPGQQLIKLIYEELTRLLGEKNQQIILQQGKITSVMLVGLQGSGKTTTAAKLAANFKKKGNSPLLIPVDIYRPAAIEQLKILAETIGVPCYNTNPQKKITQIVIDAYQQAIDSQNNIIIVDTAGRLQIDKKLMGELKEIKNIIKFQEILLVIDAMTGQESLNIANTFNSEIGIDGFILTKMDGDARGGAALSIRAITEKPIKYVGLGEKIEALEDFHPARTASKILGMGDLLTLIEKTNKQFKNQDANELEKRIKNNQFTLLDFETQLKQIKKIGSLKSIMGMIPGLKLPAEHKIDDKPMKKFEAIFSSMTEKEKLTRNILNGSRRKRIAKGSGTEVSDINQMLKQFESMKKMMKQFTVGGKKNALRNFKNMLGNQGSGLPL